MLIYQVNLNVNKDITEQFKSWLMHHVTEMLTFEGFESAQILQQKEDTENLNTVTLIVQYTIDTEEHLQHYYDNHAAYMRAEGLAKFADQFSASRCEYEILV